MTQNPAPIATALVKPAMKTQPSSAEATWCAPRTHIAAWRRMTAAADANRSAPVAPARAQVVAGDEGSPDEEEEQQPLEYECSGLLAGLALRIPARPGPGPDPPEAHRPAAIRGGLDAHRDAGMLGMRTLPGGADARVVARSPARIHRSEAVQIQAGLAKEISPVGLGQRAPNPARAREGRRRASGACREDPARPAAMPACSGGGSSGITRGSGNGPVSARVGISGSRACR